MFVFSFNFLWKNVLRVVPAHLPPALEPGSGLQQNLEPTGLSPAGPRMLQPPPGHSSRSLLRGGTGAEPGGCRGCPRVSPPPPCPIPPVHAGAVLSQRDVVLLLSSFVVPRLGQGKQQIVGCRRCWGRVSPSPDLPRRRRGRSWRGGQWLQAAHASAGAGPNALPGDTGGAPAAAGIPVAAGRAGRGPQPLSPLSGGCSWGARARRWLRRKRQGQGWCREEGAPRAAPSTRTRGWGKAAACQSKLQPRQLPLLTKLTCLQGFASSWALGAQGPHAGCSGSTFRPFFLSQLCSGQRWHRGWPVTSLSLSPQ